MKRIELRQNDKSKQWLPYIDGVMMDGVVSVNIENSKMGDYVIIRLVSTMVTWMQPEVERKLKELEADVENLKLDFEQKV